MFKLFLVRQNDSWIGLLIICSSLMLVSNVEVWMRNIYIFPFYFCVVGFILQPFFEIKNSLQFYSTGGVTSS
jgi:hypothetical protein